MSLRFVGITVLVAGLILGAPPRTLAAQDEQCEGSEPQGGMWVRSGELYLDRANRNPDPQETNKLYQDAVDILQEGFEKQPDNPRNYVMAGEAHIGLRHYTTADSLWDKAESMWSCYHTEIDSLRYNAWVRAFNLGVRYTRSEDTERATEWYRNASIIYEGLPQSFIQLANFYAQQAQETTDPEAAAEARTEAIGLYRQALGALDSERLSEEDRQQYGRAAYFNLAQLLAFDERYEEAARAYEDFLHIEPNNVLAKTNAAVVLTRGADQAMDQAEEVEAAEEKAALQAKAEELAKEAAQHYQDLLAREDLSADEYHEIGTGLARSDAHDLAVEAFNKALDLEPYRPSTLEQLAFTLYANAQYDTLVTVAKKLVERYPLNQNNIALAANAHREIEDRETALKYLEMREELEIELGQLEMERGEGVVDIEGVINNLRLEQGTPITLQFDIHDELGEVVASTTATYEAPAQNQAARFSIEIPIETPVAGFSYKRLSGEGEATGT